MNDNKRPAPFFRYSTGSKITALLCALVLCVAGSGAAVAFAQADPAIFGGESYLLQEPAPMRRTAYTPGTENVHIEGSSVELDLGITVFLDDGDIAAGYAFEFTITPVDRPSEVFTAIDEDMDGQVYIDGLAEGDYTVFLVEKDGIVAPPSITVTVQPKVVYAPIDVSDKIVDSKSIDASKDDKKSGGSTNTNGGTSTPAATDTVEYVESTTKKTTRTVEVPVLDAHGNQAFGYKPVLSATGHLLHADGTDSDLIPILDENGYITGAKRIAPVGGEEPPVVPPTPDVPPTDTTYVDATAEVLDANGAPLASGETTLFQFTKHAKVTTKTEETIVYTGWQTINGKVYYYDKNGNFVTGTQVIQGIKYFFSSEGVRDGSIGIDVSTWQGSIDWAKVKAAGIDFVFIRLGFRGYSTGKLVMDDMYHAHMRGALAAGLKVGVYFFTQAITEAEAVEEASMCIQLVRGYSISYPIAIDIEDSGSSSGRANNLTNEQRTKIAIAFCETIKSGGYRPAVYANKYYFTSMLNTSQLNSYVIWLAHYTTSTSYTGRYDIWQHSSTGKVNGISGNVDMNISYM